MLSSRIRLVGAILVSVSVLAAQEFRGTVQGTILDPNNAVVPNAAVTLVNAATQVERQVVTDQEGHYVFPLLPPGAYTVKTRAQGFKTEVRDKVDLDLGGNVRVDMTLTLGQASETITVESSAVSLAIDTTSLGSTVPHEIIDDLPLKGHSTLPIALLAPGVLDTGSNFRDDVRPVDQSASFRFSANGAPVGSGDVSVDGVSNLIDVGRGQSVNGYVPPQDSIQEFKVQTGTLPAEYGRSGGNIANMVLKSGTNQVHGSAYEYLRNAALDANLFFNNIVGQKLPVYQANLFGASLGGPIFVPKVFNGKNRAFFFFNYEGTRQGQVYSARSNMPTPKMHAGDFSERGVAIYDPNSVSNINNVWTRVPLAGSIIPASMMDPVGKKVMDYWPLPNTAGTTNAWTGNFIQATTYNGSYDMYTMKFDLNASARHQAFLRVNYTPNAVVWNPYAFNGIANASTIYLRPAVGAAVSDTFILSPKIALDFRVGLSRGSNNLRFASVMAGFDVRTLGYSEAFATQLADGPGFPQFTFSDGITNIGSNTQASTYWSNTYSTAEAVTINRGKHMFKTGLDIRVSQGNQLTTGGNGTYAFAPNQSGGPNATAPSGGFGLASLLLGFASSGSIGNSTAVSWQSVYYGTYFQDDFRVTSNLTLNLGVRWEYESPRTERYDRSVRGFAYSTPSPLQTATVKPTGGLLYAGVNGVPRGLFNNDWRDISPRVGLAYRVNKRMALRTGYSLGYIPTVTAIINTGYSISTPMVTTLDSGITIQNRLANPFPTGKLQPVGNSQGMATLLGQAISFADPSEVHGQFHNWQVSIQHTLPAKGMIEAAYVGSRGVHLAATSINLNQVPSDLFSLGSGLTQAFPNPFYGLLTSGSMTGATVQRAQLQRPYPQYTTVTRNSPRWGESIYHSFQLRYQKSMVRGVTALISYTFSKNLDNLGNPQDIYNRRQERAPSTIDSPMRLSVATTWRLPVGRGRYFLKNTNRLADLAVGGWLLSTASAFQDGNPLSFGVSGGTFYNNSTRANVIGDPTLGADVPIVQRLNRYFNTAAFAVPANFTQGSAAARIGSVRSPGFDNVNIVLAKIFQLNEKVKLDFRASQYNFLNHPVFGGQSTTVGAVGFGTLSTQANHARQTEFRARIVF